MSPGDFLLFDHGCLVVFGVLKWEQRTLIKLSTFQKQYFSLLNLMTWVSQACTCFLSISFFMVYNIRFQFQTEESVNAFLVLFHSFLVISSLLVLLTASELQSDLFSFCL